MVCSLPNDQQGVFVREKNGENEELSLLTNVVLEQKKAFTDHLEYVRGGVFLSSILVWQWHWRS